MIIELYNAWTLVENNIPQFIQYMISKRKQKYLVPKNQLLFLKEISNSNNGYQEYGWRNVGVLFKTNLISYAVQWLEEELDHVTKEDGEVVKTIYGVERIPDIMLLKEMQAYRDGLNVDRLVAFSALVAFASIQNVNRGPIRRTVKEENNLHKSNKNGRLFMSPYLASQEKLIPSKLNVKNRNPFKNFK